MGCTYVPLAQQVEHRTFNPGVEGSNPFMDTIQGHQVIGVPISVQQKETMVVNQQGTKINVKSEISVDIELSPNDIYN